MKMMVNVCDICKDPGQTAHTYRITVGGRLTTIELCERDAAPLTELLAKARDAGRLRQDDEATTARTQPVGSAAAPRRRGRRMSRRVTTIDEIERRKRGEA